jgi:hypothetical protein
MQGAIAKRHPIWMSLLFFLVLMFSTMASSQTLPSPKPPYAPRLISSPYPRTPKKSPAILPFIAGFQAAFPDINAVGTRKLLANKVFDKKMEKKFIQALKKSPTGLTKGMRVSIKQVLPAPNKGIIVNAWVSYPLDSFFSPNYAVDKLLKGLKSDTTYPNNFNPVIIKNIFSKKTFGSAKYISGKKLFTVYNPSPEAFATAARIRRTKDKKGYIIGFTLDYSWYGSYVESRQVYTEATTPISSCATLPDRGCKNLLNIINQAYKKIEEWTVDYLDEETKKQVRRTYYGTGMEYTGQGMSALGITLPSDVTFFQFQSYKFDLKKMAYIGEFKAENTKGSVVKSINKPFKVKYNECKQCTYEEVLRVAYNKFLPELLKFAKK